MSTRNAHVAAAWMIAMVAATGLASAQTGEVQPEEVRRPFRGLFGAPAGPGSTQALDFTASVFVAYDDDVYADQLLGGLTPAIRQSGWFEGIEAGLQFARSRPKYNLGADLGLGVSHYPEQNQTLGVYRAGVNVNTPLARRTSLSVAETFVYAPEFRLGLFVSPLNPGVFEDPFATVSPEIGLFNARSYRTSTNVGVSHTLHDRATIETYYSLVTATYATNLYNYFNQSAGARYRRQLTRNTGLHIGYGYGAGRYPNSPVPSSSDRRGVHNIDAGVDYGRALSVSRRTHFSFATGSALYYVGQATGGADRLNYALLGNASLSHEMGRTWTASLAYRRSVDFHEGFADPFLAQSVGANLRGLLSRRLSFQSSAAYSSGEIGAGTSNDFESTNADAGLQYALTRYLAAYVNYIYYRYTLPPRVTIDPRFPTALSRNGVRIGLSTSVPLIRAK